MSERDEIIAEMREYFEQRADAEYLPGSPGGSPNEEMKMLEKLSQLQDSLESHHRDLLAIHRVASHIAGVEPPTEDDTLTVKRVKQMAMMINELSDGQAAREQEGGEVVAYAIESNGVAQNIGFDKEALEVVVRQYYGDASLVRPLVFGDTHPPQSQGVPEELRQQARLVRNYSNPDEAFEAIPLRAFECEAISTPAAPQADEWVKCSERLPTEADADPWGCAALLIPEYEHFCESTPPLRVDVSRIPEIFERYPSALWTSTGLTRPQPPKSKED